MEVWYGLLAVSFILAIWFLAYHPDWGLPPQFWPRDPPRTYGPDDPGPIATEPELR